MISLIGAGVTTVTGVYPNFIINSNGSGGTTYTGGNGVSISGTNQIVNTSPNIPVFLNGAGTTTVTGAYPNFTINSSGAGGPVYNAGSGVSISGSNQIVNTAPDQMISLIGAGVTTVTGVYPNFIINSSGSGGTTYTAGSGVSISGSNQIVNTSPNIPVVLSGSGSTSVTGVYPSFTVSGSGGTNYIAGSNITISGNTINAPFPTSSPLTSIAGVNGITVSGVNNNFTISGMGGSGNPPWTVSGSNVILTSPTNKVGIGINNPLNDLQLSNSFGFWNISLAGSDYGIISQNVYSAGSQILYQNDGPAILMYMRSTTVGGFSFGVERYDVGTANSVVPNATHLIRVDGIGNFSPGGAIKLNDNFIVNGTAGNIGDVLISQGSVSGTPPNWTSPPYWILNGNAGTNSSVNYIGTSDAQDLNFRTNNIQRMGMTSVGNIYMGVSPSYTSSPQFLIYSNPTSTSLGENLRITGGSCNTGSGPMLTFQNACGGATITSFQDWITASIGSPYSGLFQGDLTFYTNDGNATTGSIGNPTYERMRITSTGNVGIGTSTPAAKLDVNGDAYVINLTAANLIVGNTSSATGTNSIASG